MISLAAYAWMVSLFVLVSSVLIVRNEQKSHRRLFATRLRGWLDIQCERFGSWLLRSWEHFSKYIVQLHWYYSIHSVLQMILRVIVKSYGYFESIFERNRKRAKQLRAEKRQLHSASHLQKVADHKEVTALTEAQKKKLRHKKLEETH